MPGKTAVEKRAEAEAAVDGWPKHISWNGMDFTVPSPEDWSLKTIRDFGDGKIGALAGVIGEKTWARIEDMSLRETKPLMDLIAQAAGFEDSGE